MEYYAIAEQIQSEIEQRRTFDPVHDTQHIYRQLLQAMSRPGS